METEMTAKSTEQTVKALNELTRILAPLNPEERRRAISATMVVLGDAPPGSGSGPGTHSTENGAFDSKINIWMEKNALKAEDLQQSFSFENGKVEVIATEMPGKSKSQKTLHAYLLAGLRVFLESGQSAFTDAEARELCEKSGCYDQPHHSEYLKSFKNLISGSKAAGWKINNPGLAEAAKIVKLLASNDT